MYVDVCEVIPHIAIEIMLEAHSVVYLSSSS